MDIQQLRHSVKVKWLLYYRHNRPWLVKLRIWGNYDGQRRPSSSFILATLSNLEPELTEMLPFIIALSNDPDQIVAALGLNFNPDQELKSITEPIIVQTNGNGNGITQASPIAEVKTNGNGNGLVTETLSSLEDEASPPPATQVNNIAAWVDESCTGKGSPSNLLVLSILAVISSLAVGMFVVGGNSMMTGLLWFH